MFSSLSITTTTNFVQTVVAQGEDPFPSTNNETLIPAQQQAREQLLNKEGFSVNVIARNLSAPLNLLYGPDDATMEYSSLLPPGNFELTLGIK